MLIFANTLLPLLKKKHFPFCICADFNMKIIPKSLFTWVTKRLTFNCKRYNLVIFSQNFLYIVIKFTYFLPAALTDERPPYSAPSSVV